MILMNNQGSVNTISIFDVSNPFGPPCDVADEGKLCDPGVVDEHPGLLQEVPVGRELVLEDEPVPVLVGA